MAGNTDGICGHSSDVGGRIYVIFSVDRAGETNLVEVTSRRHAVMAFMSAQGIPFKAVWGCYRHNQELSYVIRAADLAAVGDAQYLAGQESFLKLGPCDARDRRPATLIFLNEHGTGSLPGEDKNLGLFQQVTEDIAKAQDGYTYDPTTGKYFACLPAVSPQFTDRELLNGIVNAFDDWRRGGAETWRFEFLVKQVDRARLALGE